MALESNRMDCLDFPNGFFNRLTKQHKRLTWSKFLTTYCCLGFKWLLSIFPHVFITLCLKWSWKSPFIYTRQMFWSTCLTRHDGLCTHFLTSFICFRPSLVVKGLPVCNILIESPVFVGHWQFGTEFLFLANLSFKPRMFKRWQSKRKIFLSTCPLD